jgi:hypothetical protein
MQAQRSSIDNTGFGIFMSRIAMEYHPLVVGHIEGGIGGKFLRVKNIVEPRQIVRGKQYCNKVTRQIRDGKRELNCRSADAPAQDIFTNTEPPGPQGIPEILPVSYAEV